MKKILKFIPYLFVFLIGCSTSASKIPKSEIAKEYGVNENINIQFYRLDYDSFLSNQKNSSFLFPTLISRSDCKYCIEAINQLDKKAKKDNVSLELYLLDSSTLTTEEKKNLMDEYIISSVPTYITLENRSISSIETGYLSDDLYKKIKGD